MILNNRTKLYFSFSSNPGVTGLLLHNLGFKLKKLNCIYIPFKARNIKEVLLLTKQNNLGGFSLSMPFKEKILKYLNKKHYSVKMSGNCNTVLIKKKKLIGYNTDFLAILKLLKKINVKKNKILLIGNGALAKSFYYCLQLCKVKEVILCSRNLKNYKKWKINKKNTKINEWNTKKVVDANLLINATPIGMDHIKKKYLFPIKNYRNFEYFIDAVVKKKNDIFLKNKNFFKFKSYTSGLEFSLIQGIEQFYIYNNKKLIFNIMKKKLKYKF